MENIKLEYLAPSEINSRLRAFRKHSPQQLKLIAGSLKRNGCVEPVLVDSQNRIVCGEAVVAAAAMIGLNRIPVIRVDHLTDEELRAYALGANKLAELAGYDEELLALELREVSELLGDYDLTELGFETAEIDRLFGLTDVEGNAAADYVPDLQPGCQVSTFDDLWQMDRHCLLHGDALVSKCHARLMGGDLAQLVLSDVPYNRPADSISGNGKIKHPDFIQAAGELSPAEFTRFLTKAMRCMRDVSMDGSLHMIFMSWHHLLEMLRAGAIVYDELKGICTWVKSQGGQGSFYRSQTEFIAVFKQGTSKHINNIQLGRFGRNRTNAWHYDGMNTAKQGRDALLALHPTVKPLDLLQDAILDCSNRGGIVLDPFAGSGSIVLAAHFTERVARVMELDGIYVDASLRRFKAVTGIDPIRQSDGRTFSELEAEILRGDGEGK